MPPAAVTADGVGLAITRVGPRGSGRRAVLLTHAMMVDGRTLRHLAAYLATCDYDVYVLDWRGHGASTPPDPRRDHWTFDDYVTLDLPCALAAVAVRSRCAVHDIGLVGHSLGGLVALAALGTGTVCAARLALVTTGVWVTGQQGSFARRAVMAAYRGVATRLGWAPIRALRLGTADEPVGYVTQLTDWASTGRWCSRSGVDYRASLARITTPTSAWVAAGDRLCRRDDSRWLLSMIPDASLRVVGRADGDAFDPDHFTVLSRPAMQPVWREIADALA